jgi:hypothetical protein
MGSAPRLRVLIVDDSAIIRTVVVAMLEHLSATPEVATNGRDAIEAARRNHFDLILMDLHMPGLDGPSAARTILEQSLPAGRPRIVGVTGGADKKMVDACLQAGMSAVLIKPLRFNDLAPLLQPQPRADVPSEPLKASVVEELRSLDDGALLGRLAASFRNDAARRLGELEVALVSRDHTAVRAAAHALRGVAGTIGAQRIQSIAAQIEAAALSGSFEDERRFTTELASELPVVQTALDKLKGDPGR